MLRVLQRDKPAGTTLLYNRRVTAHRTTKTTQRLTSHHLEADRNQSRTRICLAARLRPRETSEMQTLYNACKRYIISGRKYRGQANRARYASPYKDIKTPVLLCARFICISLRPLDRLRSILRKIESRLHESKLRSVTGKDLPYVRQEMSFFDYERKFAGSSDSIILLA